MPCEEFHKRLVHLNPEGKVIIEFSCISLSKVRVLGIMIIEIHSQKAYDLCYFFYPIVRVFCYVSFIKVELPKIKIKIIESVLQIFEL